jgi:hypothetical protein
VALPSVSILLGTPLLLLLRISCRFRGS